MLRFVWKSISSIRDLNVDTQWHKWSVPEVCVVAPGSWWWEHVVNNSRHTAGPGKAREWEKYFSGVVTTLFHDLQWDYRLHNASPYSRWFIAAARNEKKIWSLQPQRWLLLWRSERGANVIMSMIKYRESYDLGQSQKLQNIKGDWRHTWCPMRCEIHIKAILSQSDIRLENWNVNDLSLISQSHIH